MKKYRVNVNGVAYEIELEELTGAAPVAAAPVAGQPVTAPIPGTVLSILANVGDTVQAGQTVLMLEAMKMENEIVAPVAGKVVSINVNKGAAVESGAVLFVLQ